MKYDIILKRIIFSITLNDSYAISKDVIIKRQIQVLKHKELIKKTNCYNIKKVA